MSRNGPFGQARAPQRRAPAEQDPYATAPGGQGQWAPQQPGGYPEPPYNGSQQGYPPQQAHQGYHYPQAAPEPDPQYGYPQQPHGQAPGYDRYAGQPAPAQTPYQQQPAQPQWGQQDPRSNYDLGSYMPAGTQGYAPPEPQHFQHPPEPAPFKVPQQGYAETDSDYDDTLDDGEDEPRSGRRWLVIVAALVGAIGLGGGMAYTYKMLFTSGSSRAPIVLPNKARPVVTGTEKAQVDKKLFTRLGEDGPDARPPQSGEPEAQEERPAESAVGGPRPVRIIPIAPPGGQGQVNQGQAGTTGSVNTRSGSGPMVTIPGLMIDTSGPQRGGAFAQQQQGGPPAQQMRAPVAPPPQQQQTSAEPPKRTAAVIPPPSTMTAPPAGATKVPVPRTKEPAATGAVPVSSGYVAVLSSQRSRMDAMKAYASIDQKYRDMLASSTFDVQEADLGDKGIWYRAVVGPPRSFDGAKKICDELKTAGYPACWPARY
jgi:hypothetical protein